MSPTVALPARATMTTPKTPLSEVSKGILSSAHRRLLSDKKMRIKKAKIEDTNARILLSTAQLGWEMLSNFDLQNFYFPDFASYWEECEKINKMTDAEFYELRSGVLKRVGLGYLAKDGVNAFTTKK